MKSPIFKLSTVQQSYNGRRVLNIDNLTIERSEILAVVGPSGAGKSTLLRLLNFLEIPSKGNVDFGRHSRFQKIPLEARRKITTVFQRPILLKRSVVANLRYGSDLHGKQLQDSEVDEWLQRLGLVSLAESAAFKLSAGEAQRVALARALLVRPEVLLLDEPTANLDPYNVDLIETIVREENEKRGTTIVLVTHNVFQARRLAFRTALLLQGEIVEIAETNAFFTAPRNAKTAAFLRGELVY